MAHRNNTYSRGAYPNGGNGNPRDNKSVLSDSSESDSTVQGNGGTQNSRFFKGGSNRYNNSQENNQVRIGRKHTNAVTNYSGGGGHRNSHTWVSPDTQRMQEFLVVRNAMRRLFKHSEVAKWKYSDYIAHREAMIASEKDKLASQVQMKLEMKDVNVPHLDAKAMGTLNKYLPDGNFTMGGNRSLVLGAETIWCDNWQIGKEEVAPWPSYAEMKWEGDDRAKTGVGRFLPLPREMGAPGIPWNQLQVVEQYPLDQVAKIPTMEDVYLPVDEIDDNVKYNLITRDLEKAMDALLES